MSISWIVPPRKKLQARCTGTGQLPNLKHNERANYYAVSTTIRGIDSHTCQQILVRFVIPSKQKILQNCLRCNTTPIFCSDLSTFLVFQSHTANQTSGQLLDTESCYHIVQASIHNDMQSIYRINLI